MATRTTSPRSELKKAAALHGATVHDNSTPKLYSFGIEAPAGFIWDANSCHELVADWRKGPASWNAEPVEDAIERMGYGISPCEDDECEWCHREGSDDA